MNSERTVLTSEDIESLEAMWRAANYLAVGQIYLVDNPLLREPLTGLHVKQRLLGHWGTTPGLNLLYAHLNRAILKRQLDMLLVTGPGHGGPAIIANSWIEGSWTEMYPAVGRDAKGMRKLFKQFSFPRGVPSHVAADVPGSIHEGGELGYSLAHAFGASFDNPGLTVACVIGDGEAETGPLAASWASRHFTNLDRDGRVLPILHLNGYKIANPTVLARMSQDDLTSLLRGHGWEPRFVSADAETEHNQVHIDLAAAFDGCLDEFDDLQSAAISGADVIERRWPMIVLRTPKGFTGPAVVDDQPVEGTWRAHQVPLSDVHDDEAHRGQLEAWMRSYRPEDLFDDRGAPRELVTRLIPEERLRLGSSAYANGGQLTQDLDLPQVMDHAVAITNPGATTASPAQAAGTFLRDVFTNNTDSANFRLFGPDEITSNKLNAVFEVTSRAWNMRTEDTDEDLSPDGRVMEVLSEHLCQGWLEGYLLTGRHGLFSCYEAFVHVIDSMFNQHAKWLKTSRQLQWRRDIPSLNYLLTSHVWRQDHNGFSHQDPGFIDHVVNKKAEVIRVYLPPDANTLLWTLDHCLRSRHLVNVIVAGKHDQPVWLDPDQAGLHAVRGVGMWDWASNDDGDPDVVLACAGDVPTVEILAAASLLHEHIPDLRCRVVNVMDLMRLQTPDQHPHGLSDSDFDALFTTDRPVIFAYHGYPWLIHRLTYNRANHEGMHVRGYLEEGSTTTPFDMLVRNDMDRYHLVMDVIDRVPGLAERAATTRQLMVDMRTKHTEYVVENGIDLPEVTNWTWPL